MNKLLLANTLLLVGIVLLGPDKVKSLADVPTVQAAGPLPSPEPPLADGTVPISAPAQAGLSAPAAGGCAAAEVGPYRAEALAHPHPILYRLTHPFNGRLRLRGGCR